MIQSGKLRFKIDIQSRATVQDSHGEPLPTWTSFANVRAAVERSPGREIFASAQTGGRVPVVFRIRYIEGIRPAMRIVFHGRVHNILSVVDQRGLKQELIILTEELTEAAP